MAVCERDSANHLQSALKSLADQSVKADQVVVVQDGPLPVDLTDVINVFQETLPITLVILDRNIGLGGALHVGLHHCTHEIVARMDADDISLPHRFEVQLRHLKSGSSVDILGSFVTEIDQNSVPGAVRSMPIAHDAIIENLWACPLLHPTVMYRKSPVIRVGNYDPSLRRRQDYELWFRCAHAGLKFGNVPEPLVLYRFNRETHGRQPVRLAFQQGRIGYQGTALLGLAYWKRLACFVPFFRSLLPTRLRHWIYRATRGWDPRQSAGRT